MRRRQICTVQRTTIIIITERHSSSLSTAFAGWMRVKLPIKLVFTRLLHVRMFSHLQIDSKQYKQFIPNIRPWTKKQTSETHVSVPSNVGYVSKLVTNEQVTEIFKQACIQARWLREHCSRTLPDNGLVVHGKTARMTRIRLVSYPIGQAKCLCDHRYETLVNGWCQS